jgi:hypothetical protein
MTPYLDGGVLKLPRTLLCLLRSPRVHKYGVHIKADFTRLYRDCGLMDGGDELPFVGAQELGALARDSMLAERSSVGLASLVQTVLGKSLAKDGGVRVSTGWDDGELSPDQIEYAAQDAFASWKVYEALTEAVPDQHTSSRSRFVSDITPPGTCVKLMSRDRASAVAYGTLALDRHEKWQGVNVTKTRTVVVISQLIVPGYLVRPELLKSKKPTPLSEVVNELPANVLCCFKDLLTCVGDEGLVPHSWPRTNPQPRPAADNCGTDSDVPQATLAIQPVDDRLDDPLDDGAPPGTQEGDFVHQPEVEQPLGTSERDAQGSQAATALIQAMASSPPPTTSPPLRSRVLGDIFHLMHQFKVPMRHGLRRPFCRALRDALLVPDEEDKAALQPILQKRRLSFEKMVLWHSDLVWQHVRRTVPPPEILTPRVLHVLTTFGPLKDATTGLPLFSKAAWEVATNVMEGVRAGYFSDPPGISMYTLCKRDDDGVPHYRCLRGTNSVEGGVHQNIIKRFGPYNASPRFAKNLLREYALRHNLMVSLQSLLLLSHFKLTCPL